MSIQEKLKEYQYVESLFGLDDDGNIIYDVEKDQEYAMNNIADGKPYDSYASFLEWAGKTKEELLLDFYKTSGKIKPSEEQSKIIETITKNKNVYVDAVAGSGKTTTVLFIAETNPKKSVIQITYNKQLKFEVREKAESRNIKNLEIYTYHALAVRYYDKNAYTDEGIVKILNQNKKPKNIATYDIIIIDEVQDMTPNYFAFICKFIGDMKLTESILLKLGDKYQGVYQFKGADPRFLIMCGDIWNRKLKQLTLQTSFRVTNQIAWFVNNVMLGYNRINSDKDGCPVLYYKVNIFSCHYTIKNIIKDMINKQGRSPDDFFILAGSIKSSSNPVKKLENALVQEKIPVLFSRNEEEGLNEENIRGKVVFTTFHQAKGRERKVVIVYGFDESYFDFHAKDKPRDICPSEIYVAVTRASEVLILLEALDKNPMPFLKMSYQQMEESKNVKLIMENKKIVKKKKEDVKKEKDIHTTSVSDLTRYLDEFTLARLMDLVKLISTTEIDEDEKHSVALIHDITTTGGKLCENVSDINGIAIPALYENLTTKQSTLQQIIADMYKETDPKTRKFIDNKFQELDELLKKNKKISAYLLMSNIYITMNELIYSKLEQIDRYDWLKKDEVDILIENLSSNFDKDTSLIYELSIGNMDDGKGGKIFILPTEDYGTIHIRARIDAVDSKNDKKSILWEFKCVETLTIEHKLQLILYAFIWENSMKEEFGSKIYKLLNIRTREVCVIKYDQRIVHEIVNIILEKKYGKQEFVTDEEFIKKCTKIREKFLEKKDVEVELKTKKYVKEDDDYDDHDDGKKTSGLHFFKKK